jgi:FkbM family methyltransferase
MAADTLRLIFNRLLGRQTIVNADLLGQPVKLDVTAKRELRRARKISHETDLVTRMRDYLQDGDTIYDIGANIGLISLLMALHPSGKNSKVHSFEPEPRNFEQLKKNIALNGLTERVIPQRLALGSTEGEVQLFIRGTAGEGRHSIAEAKGSTDSISVPLKKATGFARETGDMPTIVKIDVEGAEGQVIGGFEELIGEHPPRDFFMEIHSKGDGDKMPDGETIDAWLTRHGYELVWSVGRRSGEHRHYRFGGSARD